VLLVAAIGAAAQAEAPAASLESALPLLLKTLSFDRNFAARGAIGPFVILVAAEPEKIATRDALLDTLRKVQDPKAGRRPVTFVGVDFKDEATLDAAVQRHHAAAILATPGMSAAGVKAVSEVSMDNQIYSLGLDATMANQGLAVSVVEHEGHLQPVVNVPAAQAVGAVFELSLLRLARLVK